MGALVVKRTCKGTEFCMVLLARKSEAGYRKNAMALCWKNSTFLTYRKKRRKCFNSIERCSFWTIYYIILMFYNNWNRRVYLQIATHDSPVTKFTLTLKMKPSTSRQDTIYIWSVLY